MCPCQRVQGAGMASTMRTSEGRVSVRIDDESSGKMVASGVRSIFSQEVMRRSKRKVLRENFLARMGSLAKP